MALPKALQDLASLPTELKSYTDTKVANAVPAGSFLLVAAGTTTVPTGYILCDSLPITLTVGTYPELDKLYKPSSVTSGTYEFYGARGAKELEQVLDSQDFNVLIKTV